MLGPLAVFSGLLLFALALLTQAQTARLQAAAGAALERLAAIRSDALDATIAVSDRGWAFSVTTRTLRLFLQSMMLGLGAWLAIRGTITPGS